MAEAETETEFIPEATKEQSGVIKSIGKDTVHKICSGQVVLSLAVAIKELVENSIDAGATLVEVKLREQGLESVEVSDNGSGVEEHNLQGMTAKYHTSKIREFVDLQGVETFGFRGEALSSLCALSDMTVTTRHSSTDVAIKIELDHDGNIKKRTPCARSIGTTVQLTNLFATLPVRRRDFTKNVKKEFTKMCQILQAYCLVSQGVRIICTNQSAKGNKSVIMQTHAGNDVLANISAVFGARQVNDIMPIKSPFDKETMTADSLSELLKNDTGEGMQITDEDIECLKASNFQLDGYISSCSHGAGRSSKDRQYFYVNSRPCDPKQIAKVVNEVYHRYNGQQYPFVFLNIITARSEVDVNLTPDKRQLLLHNEKILLLAIKKALLNTFGNIPSTYKLQNSTILSMFKAEPVDCVKTEPKPEDFDDDLLPISSTQRFVNVLSQWKNTGETIGPVTNKVSKRKGDDELCTRSLKMQKIHDFLQSSQDESTEKNVSYKSEDSDVDENDNANMETGKSKQKSLNQSVLDMAALSKASSEYDALTGKSPSNLNTSATVERIVCKNVTPAKPSLKFFEPKAPNKSNTIQPLYPTDFLKLSQASTDSDEDPLVDEWLSHLNKNSEDPQPIIKLDDSDDEANGEQTMTQACVELRTSIEEIERTLKAEEEFLREKRKLKLERLRFKSEINPKENKNAEDELQREIGKEAFARMEILGQFNLGFIIVKLDDDLFIVDQHASDEKYNFEMLQRTTQLQYQQMAIPQSLELTAVNEMVLLDHLQVFEKNGFKFEIDENAPPTKKIKLLGKPTSKNWEFGKEDIDELIFMLQDAPEGTICRPSRVRSMFASRACRKSVMIGKALNHSAMKTIVQHMGEIEQPWNCPHGRPTMRHLINIAMLVDPDEKAE